MEAHTMENALIMCGVNRDNIVLFDGNNAAQRIANEVFDNDLTSCVNKSNSDLENDWKTYSQLTVAQGQIRLRPATKKNIRALVQWIRDKVFDITTAGIITLLRKAQTHDRWESRASDMAKTAKPKQFTGQIKWLDWRDSFINFLRSQPGRNGVPLSYVIRPNIAPLIRVNTQFLDDYVDQAPLTGEVFALDASDVHTYIVSFITENTTAENKIMPYLLENNGRRDYQALKNHYEGVGVNATMITQAEKDIETLFYSEEKRPHMWWDEFETRITVAFATIDREEGRMVYSDIAKLRLLNRKVKADFLEAARTSIELELAKVPVPIIYNIALASLCKQELPTLR